MLKPKSFTRADLSLMGQWWWTVDRLALLSIVLMMLIGVILSMAGSPSVATHLGLPSFYFVKRHMLFLPLAGMLMIGLSLVNQKILCRLAFGLFILSIFMMILTFFVGVEIKGARRWVNLLGFSLQPSEFVKPALAVLAAWMFCLKNQIPDFPGQWVATGFFLITLALLALQPDFGMIVVVSAFWCTQLFMTGIPMFWTVVCILLAAAGMVLAYFTLPHVAGRIDRFLDPASGDVYGDKYQINRSLEAFMNGGITGQGPGEGIVKKNIPDVHADFIFAVAGEEFGLLFCWVVVGVFAFFIVRSLMRLMQQNNMFRTIAVTGLVTQFGLQTIVNMSSTLRLMPTKGMTLPFISYGGSSLLACAVTVGMILSLTRKQS